MNSAVSRPVISDPKERRDHDRRVVGSDSTLRDQSGRPYAVLVRDLSVFGFAIECDWALEIGATVTLGLPGYGSAQAIVRRADAGGYGCQFAEPLAPSAFAAAFGGSNVVIAPFRAMLAPQDGFAEPDVEKWSPGARASLILGGSALLWAVVLILF